MDPSARVTMKDAAKCDKRCEWQNPANQENAERILRFQVTPESIFGSGHLYYSAVRMNLLLNHTSLRFCGSATLFRWRIKTSIRFVARHHLVFSLIGICTVVECLKRAKSILKDFVLFVHA